MSVPLFYSRNPNSFLYVMALTSAYRSGYRVYNPDLALSREPDVWEKVRRDPVIAHALEIRAHSIAGKKWALDPPSDKRADKDAAHIMEELLQNIQNFTMSRYNLSLAVALAQTFAYIEGDRKPLEVADGPLLNWWRPTRLRDVDRRRFFYEPIWHSQAGSPQLIPGAIQGTGGADRLLRLKTKMWSVARGQWEDWRNSEYFVKVIYSDTEDRLGYGRGLLEAIYMYYYMKGKVLQEGVQGLERWAQGMVIGKIDGLREASAAKPNEAIKEAMMQLLTNMRSRHVAVMDQKDDIQVVNNAGTGYQMVGDFLAYLDNSMTRMILGAVLPSGGGGSTGSFARAEVEANTQEALIQFDRTLMDEAMTRDLVGLTWRLNAPQLDALGLGKAKMPRFRTMQEEREDTARNSQVATMLMNAGVPLKRDEVYQKCGFTVPGPDDELIEVNRPGAGEGESTGLTPMPTISEPVS